MTGIDYIQQTLDEFFGTDKRRLAAAPKSDNKLVEGSLKPASDVSGSEVTFGPQGGGENHETEANH